jgi:hypothetical protein
VWWLSQLHRINRRIVVQVSLGIKEDPISKLTKPLDPDLSPCTNTTVSGSDLKVRAKTLKVFQEKLQKFWKIQYK